MKSTIDWDSIIDIWVLSTVSPEIFNFPRCSCLLAIGVPKYGWTISKHPWSKPDIIQATWVTVVSHPPELVPSSWLEKTDGWMFGITTTDRIRSPFPIKSQMLPLPALKSATMEVETKLLEENTLRLEIRMELSLSLSFASLCTLCRKMRKI